MRATSDASPIDALPCARFINSGMSMTSLSTFTDLNRLEAIKRDFERDLWCVMGLPFDATTEQGTYEHLLECIEKRRKCFLTTPNLNFVVSAQSDKAFKESVINSDWVIADGMPIIWVAKALGIPLTERVAGSSVFEALRTNYRNHGRPLKVVFFGGPDGVAAEAFKQITLDESAMEVVGFYSPGFGTIEEMSPQDVIDHINESEPDIVLVALGAKRGQAWIEYNRERLNAPVISHLGAVVNFVAGTVARAPQWMQDRGLEWLWRIWEERTLLKRYWIDGLAFLKIYTLHVLKYKRLLKKASKSISLTPASFDIVDEHPALALALHGVFIGEAIRALRQALPELIAQGRPLILDMQDVDYFDNAFIAMLELVKKHQSIFGQTLELRGASRLHKELIRMSGTTDSL